jgi:hypothetical protein
MTKLALILILAISISSINTYVNSGSDDQADDILKDMRPINDINISTNMHTGVPVIIGKILNATYGGDSNVYFDVNNGQNVTFSTLGLMPGCTIGEISSAYVNQYGEVFKNAKLIYFTIENPWDYYTVVEEYLSRPEIEYDWEILVATKIAHDLVRFIFASEP